MQASSSLAISKHRHRVDAKLVMLPYMVSNTAATSTSPELTNGLGAYIHGIYEYSDFFAATQISLKNIVSNLQSAVRPLGLGELQARHTLGCTSHRRTMSSKGHKLWFWDKL